MDLAALKTELQTDPEGIGYDSNASHQDLAKMVNTASRQVDNDADLPTWKLLEAIDRQEGIVHASEVSTWLSMGTFNPRAIAPLVREVFGQQSETFKAVRRLAKRTGSRAEELGLGRVTESDVADALLRT